MFSFVVLCILGSNESVYFKVLRDVLCESVDIKWLVDYVILEYNVDALNVKWKVISFK